MSDVIILKVVLCTITFLIEIALLVVLFLKLIRPADEKCPYCGEDVDYLSPPNNWYCASCQRVLNKGA